MTFSTATSIHERIAFRVLRNERLIEQGTETRVEVLNA